MRMRRKKHQDERIKACAQWLIKEPLAQKGGFKRLFADGEALFLEIGCGKGRFITEMAGQNPHACFIGLEKQESVLLLALEQAKAKGLQNIRFIHGDARHLPDLFAEDELSGLFINFPDPWPADRHAKRRLTHPGIAASYRNIVKPLGEIALKTDSEPLFRFSLDSMPSCGFQTVFETFDLHQGGPCGIMTEYETKFFHEGKAIMRAVFQNVK